jgi:hypothetical protein
VTVPLVLAELLRLRRRRGLLAASLLLTSGIVLLVLGVRIGLHASDPQGQDPAGGEGGFEACMFGIVGLGSFAAAAIGATAGAGDHTAGVFRDLVATGVSRLKLFAVRPPGALIAVAVLILPAIAFAGLAGFLLAGGAATPTGTGFAQDVAWMALVLGTTTVLAVGLAALAGSRGWVVGGLIIFQWVVEHLLTSIHLLGGARQLLLGPAIDTFARPVFSRYQDVSMPDSKAALVIAGWMAAALLLGGWRVVTRDT